MSADGRGVFAVPSSGRVLRVAADDRFEEWWPRLAPHVPGAAETALVRLAADSPVDLELAGEVGPGDARRQVNAELHRLHLGHGTLCLHATALRHPGGLRSVLLLGGHGAGKTLTAIALAMRDWQPLAGDVALLDAANRPAVVRGGTRAFLARRGAVARWFPELGLQPSGAQKVDVRALVLHGRGDLAAPGPVPVMAAVLVYVDGDPRAAAGTFERLDRHTAGSVWLRSSTHLLDRALEDSDVVLRLAEDAWAARRRVALAAALADDLPVYAGWGSPQRIAARIDGIASTQPRQQRTTAW